MPSDVADYHLNHENEKNLYSDIKNYNNKDKVENENFIISQENKLINVNNLIKENQKILPISDIDYNAISTQIMVQTPNNNNTFDIHPCAKLNLGKYINDDKYYILTESLLDGKIFIY